MKNHFPPQGASLYGGKLFWSRAQVRVRLLDGRLFDLGPRHFEAAQIVANMFDMEFIYQSAEKQNSHAKP